MHPLAQRAIDKFIAAFDHGGKKKNPKPEPLMRRFYRPQRLPKENPAVKRFLDRGFDSFVEIRGVGYMVKHGTWYRLDKLMAAA